MRNRYYAVGSPIEELQSGYLVGILFSIKERKITQEELEQSSFFNQERIRLFSSYDQAKEYSHGLRHNSYDFSFFPKTPISRSKVRPVFTLDLDAEITLGDLKNESFNYNEHYVNESQTFCTRKKEVQLNFYEVNSNLISNEKIIRAEFFQSKIKAVEFSHGEQSQLCAIM